MDGHVGHTFGDGQYFPTQQHRAVFFSPLETDVSMDQCHLAPEFELQPNIPAEYIRCTVGMLPKSANVAAKTGLPIAATITPYPKGAADSVPVIERGIIRCKVCRTYINPYAEVLPGGTRWKCNICGALNDTPEQCAEINTDTHEELRSFVYDFIAPSEYMCRPPQPQTHLFLVDVSQYAMKSGLFGETVETLKSIAREMPDRDGRARFGVVLFDSRVYCVDFAGGLRISIVSDVDGETLLPTAHSVVCNLRINRDEIVSGLGKIQASFQSSTQTESCLGYALKTAVQMLSGSGGKVVCVTSTGANVGAGAATQDRGSLLHSSIGFYKELAMDGLRSHICVDFFVLKTGTVDVRTIGETAHILGGKIFFYQTNSRTMAGQLEKYRQELFESCLEECGLEAVLRVRCSSELVIQNFYGSLFMRTMDLINIPAINHRHSYTVVFKHEKEFKGRKGHIQAAFLFTSSSGERMIRVMNIALGVTDNARAVVEAADDRAVVGAVGCVAADMLGVSGLSEAREYVTKEACRVVEASKSLFGTSKTALQMPSSLGRLLLGIDSLLSISFLDPGMAEDERAHQMFLFPTLSTAEMCRMLFPRLWSFSALLQGDTSCQALRRSTLKTDGVYIMDDLFDIYVFVGENCSEALQESFFSRDQKGAAVGECPRPERFSQLLAQVREETYGVQRVCRAEGVFFKKLVATDHFNWLRGFSKRISK
ncbi:MAG: protein transporter SEC24 [Amphiamblys sp. WSBS2006]|nr:MAG: protein transporter SEC24 [Amphiamblys sp. WSBS2006]